MLATLQRWPDGWLSAWHWGCTTPARKETPAAAAKPLREGQMARPTAADKYSILVLLLLLSNVYYNPAK